MVYGCSATPSVFVNDPLPRIQNEVKQLKRSNEESIATLKQTYDEEMRTYNEKIATLEQQRRPDTLFWALDLND